MSRKRAGEERHQDLIDATIAVIARNGLVGTRIADVAKAAGVSYGVVNFYFKSKDALLRATLDHLAEEYEREARQAVESAGASPVAKLFALVGADFSRHVARADKIAAWTAFWSESRAEPAFRRRCRELQDHYLEVSRALCAEAVTASGSDADPELVAAGLNHLVTGLWVDIQIRGGSFSRDQARRICRSYLAHAFPEEVARLDLAPA